ncbi:MAG TPA: STAS domain-containing protein [Nitrospira sp.]|nr:STAS domain-containing protein [Nitrospira sp.]
MHITQRTCKEATILALKGDLTYDNRATFKAAVEQVKQTACRHLVLNMEEVQFLDSAGLGLLALLSQSLKLSKMQFSIVQPQSYVREIMMLANISALIPIFGSESEALASTSVA